MLHTPNEAANRSSRCPIHSHEHKRMQGTRWSDLQQGTAKETKSFPNSMSRNRASRDQYHSLNSRGEKKKKRSAEKDERSSQLRTVPLDRLAACDAGQDEEEEEEKERADGQEPGGGGGGGHGRVGKLRLRARMDSSGARRGRPYERERERGEGRWRRGGGGVGDGSAGEGSGVEWSGRMGTRTPPAQPHAHWLAACRVGGLAGWAPRTGTATTGTWSVAEPERNTVFYSIHQKK